MKKLRFDYAKLRGRIIEKCGAQMVFADRLGVTQGTLTSKLQGHTFFTQPEIFRSMDILDIDPSEVTLYFFTI